MPQIEILPNTGAAPAPGWAYVPDTGYDPSKVAINPKDRKRIATRPGGGPSGNELSARQQTAIQRRLAELEKDNNSREAITIPGKAKSGGAKTPATKKILTSQKNIAHWLADEEALLQQAQSQSTSRTAISRTPAAKVAKTPASKAKRGSLAATPSTPTQAATPTPFTSDTPSTATPAPATITPPARDDSLLDVTITVPPPLNEEAIAALLAAPPLPYAAARAGPPSAIALPQRHFCDTCGYWGRIRCLKCGARVCGLECKDAHEQTRCTRF
ncbi:hypothetical protein AOQ84DRAFT_59542 [Glonium stellatum]|uniref:HIT-type domain-containing protein n=1 Tax=Glonium stellatum TaxID=574774 RepID=A0A8E2JYQ1_9PEZI|nr:hypothetical protein AOQ84DRAFT_59542 [Glonium stellatum]